jgi:hypothetical protein
VDCAYATYFPWERRYVSLFRGEGERDDDGPGRGGGDLEVRARIAQAMGEEGGGTAALEAIRCELTVVERIEARREDGEGEGEDDDESDGGFFE